MFCFIKLIKLFFLIVIHVIELWCCILSAVSRLTNPIAKWDTKGTQTILLQPFSPIVIAADENERIRYEELINTT